MKTADMEKALIRARFANGRYFVKEVMMPSWASGGTGMSNERVDILEMSCKKRYDQRKGSSEIHSYEWRFYELKLTKSDFYSKCKHTFLGNYNYYVVPDSLYEVIKNDVPDYVGVYTVREVGDRFFAECKKKPKRRDCTVEGLLHAFLQSACRDCKKLYLKEE